MYESPYQKAETEELISQVNELRALLATCWELVPDGTCGAGIPTVKQGMTKYGCWPRDMQANT